MRKSDWKKKLKVIEKDVNAKRWATPSAIALRKLLEAGRKESDDELMLKYRK